MGWLTDALTSINNYLGGSLGPNNSSIFGSSLGKLLSSAGSAIQTQRSISDIEDAQRAALQGLVGAPSTAAAFPQGILSSALGQMQFQPYTVTTATGGTVTPGDGTLQYSLGAGEQALTSGLLSDIERMRQALSPEQQAALESQRIAQLTASPEQLAAREQSIFDRLEAAQQGSRERQRLALEERLLGQGRLGVRTSQYGGTPEQLALEKAIQEQQAGSAVSAMEQARAEQALQSQQTLAGLQQAFGQQQAMAGNIPALLGAAYLPQQGLLASLAPTTDMLRIQSALQAGAGELTAGLGESALEAQFNFEGLSNALRQAQLSGLFNLLATGVARP